MHSTAIITGASSGIGAACAQHAANSKRYSDLVLCARRLEKLDELAAKISAAHPHIKVHPKKIDLSESDAIASLFKFIKSDLAPISLLVNNAAAIFVKPIVETSEAEFARLCQLNINAVYNMSKHAMTHLSQDGVIVNISSLAGMMNMQKFPQFSAYSTTKHAVVGISEATAAELKSPQSCICIAPGAVDTDMLRQAAPDLKTQTTPDDVANFIFNIADPKIAKMLNGVTIPLMTNAD